MKNRFWKLGGLTLGILLIGAGCLSNPAAPDMPEPVGNDDEAVDTVTEHVSESGNVILTSPLDGDAVTSPITVTGSARVFENNVSWRIEDANGTMLKEGFMMANAPDVGEFGPFEERIFLPVIETDTFFLQVFTYSAKDGEEQDQVRVELVPLESGKTSVNVFFTDPAFIEGGGDCAQVDVEKRTVQSTVNVAELAMQELIAGPESDWASTQVPEFTTLNSISISDGVAKVDFGGSTAADWSGGSCHVIALRAQIEETLKQFSSVSTVEITVNGSSDILEP